VRWIATCARGLEELLAEELSALGLAPSPPEMGGVGFHGGWREGLRANWRLTAANRVLVEIASWPAATDDELYRGARAIVDRLEPMRSGGDAAALPLIELFSFDRTFSIQATSTASKIRDTRWIAMKVKDAIVDGQRARFGARSDVDREDPDTALRLRLRKDRATLLVDTSGEPLDRRGYRVTSTAAPLRENLAAACLLASSWNGAGPVVDPMCGSGTFLAEAGALALGLAPNRLRERWAFEKLPGFELRTWDEVRADAIAAPGTDVRLVGVDLAGEAMVASRRNLERAGLLDQATLVAGDAFAYEPPQGPGLLAVNPPHGERMLDDREAWKKLGDLLKQRYSGWKAVVFAGGESQGKFLGLKPSRRVSTWAGPLPVKILVFDLW
jgi:putative N6-adenine-specific DNA methylase